MVPTKTRRKPGSSVDWLKERALERSQRDTKPDYYYKSREVKKSLKVMDTKDKFDFVKRYSHLMSNKAKMKDEIIRADGDGQSASVQELNELNEILIESIKSKIMLLGNMKQ